MSGFNPLADSLATARAKGREDVLGIVRAALPATAVADIEDRVRRLTTVDGEPKSGSSDSPSTAKRAALKGLGG